MHLFSRIRSDARAREGKRVRLALKAFEGIELHSCETLNPITYYDANAYDDNNSKLSIHFVHDSLPLRSFSNYGRFTKKAPFTPSNKQSRFSRAQNEITEILEIQRLKAIILKASVKNSVKAGLTSLSRATKPTANFEDEPITQRQFENGLALSENMESTVSESWGISGKPKHKSRIGKISRRVSKNVSKRLRKMAFKKGSKSGKQLIPNSKVKDCELAIQQVHARGQIALFGHVLDSIDTESIYSSQKQNFFFKIQNLAKKIFGRKQSADAKFFGCKFGFRTGSWRRASFSRARVQKRRTVARNKDNDLKHFKLTAKAHKFPWVFLRRKSNSEKVHKIVVADKHKKRNKKVKVTSKDSTLRPFNLTCNSLTFSQTTLRQLSHLKILCKSMKPVQLADLAVKDWGTCAFYSGRKTQSCSTTLSRCILPFKKSASNNESGSGDKETEQDMPSFFSNSDVFSMRAIAPKLTEGSSSASTKGVEGTYTNNTGPVLGKTEYNWALLDLPSEVSITPFRIFSPNHCRVHKTSRVQGLKRSGSYRRGLDLTRQGFEIFTCKDN
ncbi:hypothetical protein METBIDRAFT_11708 [Metschnikowia bicuspidata var. bicuspidata NRRL YB-4993]|uniref:Uncharacterized protein n=1 Tax=Metschnikowia bicuspidata var. bicuspidata NRRL YB-4993 TaxID=869754 RepID=A0A1A0HB75_9ASCO|nr:hypothetical protein METBIDRAFT_11708 [Metschnikowia bicuspidata var. bicuspidata NRRL YB-4993]OBA21143.1 hypothetical protein METBIDRAFT_11708 [Metschnikowia bicuspidata var. bicuspidata NRRL YB-4993]